ncbi:MAG: fimbrillin family protein [Muribaculaceae bacterium]|nr:fimbrillin family protein [Muribaculaceae bacterium]MDE6702775.1 fimbrillin family protein [Muribaculaceae bacterium]
MKKSFLFLAVCAAALTACTSEEVIEEGVQSNAIGFQQIVNKPSRGLDAENPLTAFYVFGYYTTAEYPTEPVTIFSGDKVTKTGENDGKGVWGYDNARYWVPDATYKFFAYSCENNNGPLNEEAANGTAGMTHDANGYPTVKIAEYICNNDHQHDLVFAVKENVVGKEKDNAAVALTFSHLLTKLKVKFVSKFPNDYKLKISNVQISNIYTKATYSLAYSATAQSGNATWTTSGETEYALNVKDGSNMVASAEIPAVGETPKVDAVNAETAEAYVIPHKYTTTNVQVSFKVDFVNGDNVMMSRVFTGSWTPDWQAGYSYLYTINVTGSAASLEKIEFGDPTVGDWTEAPGNNTITFGAEAVNN